MTSAVGSSGRGMRKPQLLYSEGYSACLDPCVPCKGKKEEKGGGDFSPRMGMKKQMSGGERGRKLAVITYSCWKRGERTEWASLNEEKKKGKGGGLAHFAEMLGERSCLFFAGRNHWRLPYYLFCERKKRKKTGGVVHARYAQVIERKTFRKEGRDDWDTAIVVLEENLKTQRSRSTRRRREKETLAVPIIKRREGFKPGGGGREEASFHKGSTILCLTPVGNKRRKKGKKSRAPKKKKGLIKGTAAMGELLAGRRNHSCSVLRETGKKKGKESRRSLPSSASNRLKEGGKWPAQSTKKRIRKKNGERQSLYKARCGLEWSEGGCFSIGGV